MCLLTPFLLETETRKKIFILTFMLVLLNDIFGLGNNVWHIPLLLSRRNTGPQNPTASNSATEHNTSIAIWTAEKPVGTRHE